MPVGTMLETMSSDELTYWKAYFELEREDLEYEKMKAKR